MMIPPGNADTRFSARLLGEAWARCIWPAIMLQRMVALKFIRSSLIDQGKLARFFQEAQSVAQLAHPNIITLFGIHPGDHANDAPFFEVG